MNILPKIDGPQDLKRLSVEEFRELAREIRRLILETVAKNGGHLSSNLGVVELTIALHSCYDFLDDRLILDVGHQVYPHKILTGRWRNFDTLRKHGGVSGFSNRDESPYDPFTTGHAGTAISTAVGIACGDRLAGRKRRVVVLVGDASITAGMSMEAMNHAGDIKADVLVILNDNRHAISHTVGAFHHYLTKVRSMAVYKDIKNDIHTMLSGIPKVGPRMDRAFQYIREAVKTSLVPGRIFEDFGFNYYGPVDGHRFEDLLPALREVQKIPGPVLLHVLTEKGRGVPYTESDPIRFHSPKPFDTSDGTVLPVASGGSSASAYTDVFRKALIGLARENPRIAAITAAMPDGTGLLEFRKMFPERYFDVGIAEEHAVGLAAGLLAAGAKPVVAVYSTFLQRAYDQIFHEIVLQDIAPVFMMDRAGVVGDDGPTHNGVFDIAYLRHFPGMVLMAPKDGPELEAMLKFAVALDRPAAIRYPKENVPPATGETAPLALGRAEVLREGSDVTLVAYGAMTSRALEAASRLANRGVRAGVVNARFAKPLDEELLAELAGRAPLVTVEDHALDGGFGEAVVACLSRRGIPCDAVTRLGIPDRFLAHGARDILLRELGLDPEGIAASVETALRGIRGVRVAGRDAGGAALSAG
ncbi:MAG: 1-deoxy-D-xylulose-5-phosphate synthase [Planctomycetota bacterium]